MRRLIVRRSSVILRVALIPALVLACASFANLRAAEGESIQLKVGGETVRAFIAEEGSGADRPGVVVVHGWWGLNAQMMGVTERVAELGYVAIVPDLYRGRLPADLGYAHDFMRDLDEEWVMQVLKESIRHLRAMPGASQRPVGMIGFDMGGELTLAAAVRGLPIQTAISFYGDTIDDPAELELLEVPFLGIFARDDRATPPDEVKQFESMLEELGKSARIVTMPEVGRYFSNEDRPGYDPEATSNAWSHTSEFLASYLDGADYEPRRRKGKAFRDERIDKDADWKKKQPPK